MNIYAIVTLIIGLAVGAWICVLYYKNKELKDSLNSLGTENKDLKHKVNRLQKYYDKKNSIKRKALYNTGGWHNTQDKKNNPNNYKTWNTILTLEETGERTKDKSKFKILDYVCSDGKKHDSVKFYQSWFERKFNGGWLKHTNVEWIITKTKAEHRDDRLTELLDD